MGSRQICQTAAQEAFKAFDMVFMLAVSGVISPVKMILRPDLKKKKMLKIIQNVRNLFFLLSTRKKHF